MANQIMLQLWYILVDHGVHRDCRGHHTVRIFFGPSNLSGNSVRLNRLLHTWVWVSHKWMDEPPIKDSCCIWDVNSWGTGVSTCSHIRLDIYQVAKQLDLSKFIEAWPRLWSNQQRNQLGIKYTNWFMIVSRITTDESRNIKQQ